ncbi:aminotransferase class V-fold PLP-dependent enzyme [Mycoplasma wenyonii]|uniref:aminotransferase class V-fold PLP-dependent enzyme n=1 Tax=Mycoplasma wenyonii TaxID=65123 RepID=UPI0015ECD126|nr:aminotransferase class V-fold PLP-dependent enzyme [Mycoplasma wenyonii]
MITKSKELIYFDNATTSFKLLSFIDRLLQSYSDTSWIKDKEEYLKSLLEKLASWLRVALDQIALVPSSTYAINEIFERLIESWNQYLLKVYISESEHISNLASLWNFREKNKDLIKIQYYQSNKKVVHSLTNEKGIILITLRDNLGNRNWSQEEIETLSQNNPELVIIGDFTQSMLTDDISEIKDYFDYFYFSAHKIFGPFGLGCIVSPKIKNLVSKCLLGLDWRSIYVWNQEFENILNLLKNSKTKTQELIDYWVEHFPERLGFSYTHYPNSLIFLVKSNMHSIHDFAYLLEEHRFIFRFNDLCSSNSLLASKAIIRFSLSPLNNTSELEKLFELMRYFEKSIKRDLKY